MKCEACGHENVEGARFCAGCGAALPARVESEQDPLVGQVIGGRFHVTGVLGEGGMGIVYVGEQQMGSAVRKVAVKTLHSHLSKDANVLARFHRECGTVAQLEHPNTIKVYDFGATPDGTLYIAMEFVAGRALSEVIEKDGPLSTDRVVHILRQVCGALDEAHRLGIVHRDLKPENIILTDRAGETDFVKVLDFGIAARTESADAQKEKKLTQQGMVLGTPPYMSPEQFTGKSLDARSDVYSLGIMAYEMLTGRLPFEADTPWQWATQHMTAQPIPIETIAPTLGVSPSVSAAIVRALSKEREQRQEGARAFFDEISGGAAFASQGSVRQDMPSGDVAYQPTAAMPQVPAYVAGSAPAAQPAMVPAAAPAGIAPLNVPAQRGGRKAQGKGPLLWLSGLGLVLVVAIVIVVIRTNKTDSDQPFLTASLDSSGSGNGAPAVVAAENPDLPQAANPTTSDQQTAVAVSNTPSTSGKTTSGKKTTGSSASGGAPSSVAAPATVSNATTATQSATAVQTAVAASGDTASCSSCQSAASSGNIASAALSYRKCSDAAQKANCSRTARRTAVGAARTAALNQRCAEAKAIIKSAESMGAGSGPLSKTLAGTSCQ